MNLFWCYRGDQDCAPYLIAITLASSHAAACFTFGEPDHSPTVHVLTSPAFMAPEAYVREGHLKFEAVDRLPSTYDRFKLIGRGYDLQAMEDAGFDPY